MCEAGGHRESDLVKHPWMSLVKKEFQKVIQILRMPCTDSRDRKGMTFVPERMTIEKQEFAAYSELRRARPSEKKAKKTREDLVGFAIILSNHYTFLNKFLILRFRKIDPYASRFYPVNIALCMSHDCSLKHRTFIFNYERHFNRSSYGWRHTSWNKNSVL